MNEQKKQNLADPNVRKRFVTYKEAAELYSMGLTRIQEHAKIAGATYKMGNKVLVNTDIFEAYLILWKKQKSLDAEQYALKEILIFMEKADLNRQASLAIRYHGLPEGEDASFFLCKELIPGYLNGITGEYAPPAGYLVNEKEAEAFDREFPYMEKKKLLGQIFE